jgi:hypothetical protein
MAIINKKIVNNDKIFVATIDGFEYVGFFKEIKNNEIIINPINNDENKLHDINIEIEEIIKIHKLRC